MKSLNELTAALPDERRAAIQTRAQKLIAEEMTLRKARPLTRERTSEILGIGRTLTALALDAPSEAPRMPSTDDQEETGANRTTRFVVGGCWLGTVLVALRGRAIGAILLGDDPAALVREVRDLFPGAERSDGDAGMEHLLARVTAFIDAPHTGLDLPLDPSGTPFQHLVWQALRAIPPGETVTYTGLARRIGMPEAVRAVAGACAANRIAVAIPCHRVVRGDGGLAGYRWGVERKRALIERELAEMERRGDRKSRT